MKPSAPEFSNHSIFVHLSMKNVCQFYLCRKTMDLVTIDAKIVGSGICTHPCN